MIGRGVSVRKSGVRAWHKYLYGNNSSLNHLTREIPMKVQSGELAQFSQLKNKCEDLGPQVYWGDQETHHGELMYRFQSAGIETPAEAAILATIQSGYWPDWLVVEDEALKLCLEAHCKEVASLPKFGTTLFGGYFVEDD